MHVGRYIELGGNFSTSLTIIIWLYLIWSLIDIWLYLYKGIIRKQVLYKWYFRKIQFIWNSFLLDITIRKCGNKYKHFITNSKNKSFIFIFFPNVLEETRINNYYVQSGQVLFSFESVLKYLRHSHFHSTKVLIFSVYSRIWEDHFK